MVIAEKRRFDVQVHWIFSEMPQIALFCDVRRDSISQSLSLTKGETYYGNPST